ncbi:cyclic pyranopterin monophosphate synthase MoaC [Rhodoflexus caldus]|uniref:cyclic pyranopterin monophosphate synthase MoaC n=1 Tax=Rhodoflexus caldus TaxID=2891236 RepID=UPI002029E80A|nr:cyclic pyranopterin monophosphate synthase MoaC [Rhodoflexus caldus]
MLTHLNESQEPRMVDISQKAATIRMARAQALVSVGSDILALLENGDIRTPKGAVFQTAIIAGIMAAKRTDKLIPLCHSLGMDGCDIDITAHLPDQIVINCTARVTGKTGVEMEALTGATIAALTIYDMCKAISHNIIIREIKLMEKRGGKSDFTREETPVNS